jgi:hypothetical protein
MNETIKARFQYVIFSLLVIYCIIVIIGEAQRVRLNAQEFKDREDQRKRMRKMFDKVGEAADELPRPEPKAKIKEPEGPAPIKHDDAMQICPCEACVSERYAASLVQPKTTPVKTEHDKINEAVKKATGKNKK